MERKVRVLNVIWSMGDGGAQQVVLNYLRDFKDDPDIDFMLCVYTSPTDSKYDQEIEKEKYNVIYLNNPKTKLKIPYIKRYFQRQVSQKAWAKVIGELKPDIVHVHISALLGDVLPGLVQNKVPVRFDTLHSNPYRYQGSKKKIIMDAFCNHNVIPICITELQVQQAKAWYGVTNYEIVRNGVDIEQIQRKICSRIEARKALGIADDAFVVLGVGRLNPIKKFDLLLESFAEVCRKKENARLFIAGEDEGKEKERLLNKTKQLGLTNSVVFLGNVLDVTKLYCAADVLAVTSETESCSLVAIEAQACGTRCVLSSGVPQETVLLKNARRMKADATKDDWCQALLDEEYVGVPGKSLEDYEVHKTSQRMKSVYLKHYSMYGTAGNADTE